MTDVKGKKKEYLFQKYIIIKPCETHCKYDLKILSYDTSPDDKDVINPGLRLHFLVFSSMRNYGCLSRSFSNLYINLLAHE